MVRIAVDGEQGEHFERRAKEFMRQIAPAVEKLVSDQLRKAVTPMPGVKVSTW
jgi:hypothetical protein